MARSQLEQQRRGYSLWVSRQFVFGLTTALLANQPRYEVIKAPGTLPIDSGRVWKGAAVYFEPREEGFWHVMRAYYPDAQFQAVTPPAGGEPMYYTGFVSREQLAKRQGLDVTYTVRGAEVEGRSHTVTESVWRADAGPGQYPHEVRIEGALHFPVYGEYELLLADQPALVDAVVELDGRIVLGAGRTRTWIAPAAGLHTLSIRGTVDGPDGVIRVLWRPPGGEFEPIAFSRLYRGTVRPIGLAGRFFEGLDADRAAASAHVTPAMDIFYYDPVIPEPYTASWDGTLNVDDLGLHKFRVDAGGPGKVALFIDGVQIVPEPRDANSPSEAALYLWVGEHNMRVEYRPEAPPSEFEIMWAPPDRPFGPVPVESMTPAPEHMLRVVE